MKLPDKMYNGLKWLTMSNQYVDVIKKQAMMERDIKTVFTHIDNMRADIRGYHQNGG